MRLLSSFPPPVGIEGVPNSLLADDLELLHSLLVVVDLTDEGARRCMQWKASA